MIFIVSAITALFWHYLLERLWLASLGSTITAVLITLALVATVGHLNYSGDDFIINVLQLIAISFIISTLVGVGFKTTRSKHANKKYNK